MKFHCFNTVGLAVAMSAVSAFATTPTIGVASTFGRFTVNSAQVSGNANLFDGSRIRTDKAASPNSSCKMALAFCWRRTLPRRFTMTG